MSGSSCAGPHTTLQVLNKLRIIAERAAASPQKLSTMFQTYDQDGSGEIAYDEFDIMVKEMGCRVKGANSAEQLLERFDKQGLLLRAAAPYSPNYQARDHYRTPTLSPT